MTKSTDNDIKRLIKDNKKPKVKKNKKKMKSVKKAFWSLIIWALIMQTYVMVMIAKLQDTGSLMVVAGIVFGEIIAFFIGYLNYSLKIDIKSMDMNFNPNYDDEKGKY